MFNRASTELKGFRKPAAPRFQGLTLVELLVVIVLVGVAVSLALPSYRAMVEKRRLTQGTEQVFAFLNTAQAAATRSNSTVTVSWSRTSETDWCLGSSLSESPCDCTENDSGETDFCVMDGAPSSIDSTQVGKPRIIGPDAGGGSLAYEPVRGLLEDPADAVNFDFHSLSGDFRLRLIVAATGLASVCSVDESHRVPGYAVCP